MTSDAKPIVLILNAAFVLTVCSGRPCGKS